MEELTITQERHDEVAVLRLEGRIDVHAAERLRRACREALEEGARNLVLDLAGVSFVSSTGLGTFLVIQQEVAEAGGRAVFAALQDIPRHVLEVLNLASYLNLADSRERALALLRAPSAVPVG